MKIRNRFLSIVLTGVMLFSLIGCSQADFNNEKAGSEGASEVIVSTDYSDKNNWFVVPDEIQHEVDLIYFYPTAYSPESEADPVVCDINNTSMRSGAAEVFKTQATAFEPYSNVYTPFYRQIDAASLAGKTQKEMIEAENGEPKHDAFAALDYYFENYNEGRPYILAGHSQGAMMLYLVLDEYMAQHPDRYENMVAAYMIGNAATREWLDENPHVKMAQGADDTGVLVTWNTEGPDNMDAYNMVVPEGSVCINPLNWKTDETPASISENKGSLKEDSEGNYVVGPGIADATINLERGSVICSTVDPATYAIPAEMEALFGAESYHGGDYTFYYENIRENGKLRSEMFLAQRWPSQ